MTQQDALRFADHLAREVGLIVDPFLQHEWRSTVPGSPGRRLPAGGRDRPSPRAGFIRIIPKNRPSIWKKQVFSRHRLS
jgi:hypothetical protein